MTTTNPTCKTCRWMEVPNDPSGRRVVRDRAYRCLAVLPDMPRLPICVTMDSSFHWPPHKMMTWRDLGADCPCWEVLT